MFNHIWQIWNTNGQITLFCKFNLFTYTNLNQLPSVLHQRPRVPFYDMGRKKVPCSHYVLRWNVLLVKMMVRKLEWLSHNGIDIGNCFIHQSYKRSKRELLRRIIFIWPSLFCKNAIFYFSSDFSYSLRSQIERKKSTSCFNNHIFSCWYNHDSSKNRN